jgi:hypothetical protein
MNDVGERILWWAGDVQVHEVTAFVLHFEICGFEEWLEVWFCVALLLSFGDVAGGLVIVVLENARASVRA